MNRNPTISPDELRKKLVWVMLFRVVAISTLLGATIARTVGSASGVSVTEHIFIYLIVATYATTIAYVGLIRFWRNLPAQAVIQLAGDLVLATFVCWYTGRNESVFTILFPFYVIVAAILMFRVGAFFAAAAGTAAVAVLAADQHLHFLPAIRGMIAEVSEVTVSLPQIIYKAFINVAAIFMVAALASYLSEQIRRTGRELEEKKASLLDLTALHEAIVRSIPSGVLTFSPPGEINYANGAASRLLSIPEGDLVGRPLGTVFPEVRGGGGKEDSGEAFYRAPDGDYRVLAYHLGDLHDHTGRAAGGMVVFTDVTALREMEEAVRRGEKLAALGKVAAGLAHEIRNPLAAITGSVELLQKGQGVRRGDDDALMNIVSAEAERLNDLIEKFLLYARPAPPRFEDADLSRLVAETVKVFRFDNEVGEALEIREHVSPAIVARIDPSQVKQVMWNLLRNAAQAVGGKGAVDITLGKGERAGEVAVLHVADTGVGIAKEDLARVFDPFFSTREKGTGLGLSIAHSIMVSHGGSIEVESAPRRGSTFTVRFGMPKEGAA